MQSIEHCIVYHTKLYAVMACCAVDNTHAERFGEAMAERVMIEANLWTGDSLSRANFRFGHCVNIGVQHGSLPAALLSAKAILEPQGLSKLSSSRFRRCIHL